MITTKPTWKKEWAFVVRKLLEYSSEERLERSLGWRWGEADGKSSPYSIPRLQSDICCEKWIPASRWRDPWFIHAVGGCGSIVRLCALSSPSSTIGQLVILPVTHPKPDPHFPPTFCSSVIFNPHCSLTFSWIILVLWIIWFCCNMVSTGVILDCRSHSPAIIAEFSRARWVGLLVFFCYNLFLWSVLFYLRWLPLFLLFCLSLEALDLRIQITDSIRERTEREYKMNDTEEAQDLNLWCSLGHGLEPTL